ncbi:MAG: short-chain dehydrogenase [Bacteroidetes bacterium RIFCSPLOWO2_02_FULL_36_8]|nr:MAG: short-chain dehydrogenase [Bacteroidetes bacterium RIFCSPLOWO2_02_FULL_36_8]OFY70344.1 MAG: short-chain dehydrogenase [Bacteroidetes bacterium RIFCSPLOWO2_12_FULL_37_12]
MNNKKTALVTGGNRGIGLEICRQLAEKDMDVILCARDAKTGKSAVEQLKKNGYTVHFFKLEVTSDKDRKLLKKFIEKDLGKIDILVNNAGISIDRGKFGYEIEMETFVKTMETNVYGPLALSQLVIPFMKKNKFGRIVNISSGMGAIDSLYKGYLSYRVSKTCLNAMTIILADELRGTNILVNAADPGWVKTEMGGPSAPRSVEKGAETAVFLAQLPDKGPSGKFFRDKLVVPW